MLPCESEYRQLGGIDDDEEAADMDDLEQADWVNTFFSTAPLPEEIGRSQLGARTRDAGLHSWGADTCS